MTGFTDKQRAALDADLDRSNVKQREQAGRKFSYIEGWHAIAEANRIFGFDGWSAETLETRLVAEKPRDGKTGWTVSYIARVRVTVIAGDRSLIREGVGAGHGIDVSLGNAHESAIKEAATDAIKRALITFGNPFGLALYDKSMASVASNVPDAMAEPERQERIAAAHEADPHSAAAEAVAASKPEPKPSLSSDGAMDMIASLGEVSTVSELTAWERRHGITIGVSGMPAVSGSGPLGRLSNVERDSVKRAWQARRLAVLPKGSIGRTNHQAPMGYVGRT